MSQIFQIQLLYIQLTSTVLNAGSEVSSDLLNSAIDKSLLHCITSYAGLSDLPSAMSCLLLSCKPCNYLDHPSVGASH